MKKKVKVLLTSGMFVLIGGLMLPVYAQSLLPKEIGNIFNLLGQEGSGAAGFVTSRIQLGLVIALGAVVLIAVVFAISAAIKYVSSQGDAGKIEEAQKAITSILLGVAAMLLAIVGIVLVFVFFGASRPDPSLFQTCLSAPNSVGCKSCLAGEPARLDDDSDWDTSNACGECEGIYAIFAEGVIDKEAVKSSAPDCVDPISATTP